MEHAIPLGARPDPHMPAYAASLDHDQSSFLDELLPQRALVEEIEEDVATWGEIKVTTLFTMVTSLVFLLIFEFSRRKPSVAAVFDRRRSTKPTRTPPPLMSGGRIFEWVFLSTDPAYLEYSAMVHEEAIIKERRRQRRHMNGEVVEDDEDHHRWQWVRRLPFLGRRREKKRQPNLNRIESIESIVEEEMPQVSMCWYLGCICLFRVGREKIEHNMNDAGAKEFWGWRRRLKL